MSTDGSGSGTKPVPIEEPSLESLQAEIQELRTRIRSEDARHSAELTQFAHAASHDMREPLRMIASYTQLLHRRYAEKLDDDGREFMGFILNGVHSLERLLEDLLAYSLQLRPLDQPPATVDSEAAARGVLLNLEKSIRESGAEITFENLPEVQSNFTHLSQVFYQLITNSIRFRGPEPPRIRISAVRTEDEVTFSVADNGLGIDPKFHEEIFRAFRRLQGREYPGTGVGLAIAKRIVEQYGGKIWVESGAGQGATFRFTVPV
ncbi:MAG TPA: ATP-binding protein [Bryobacteraceae bacterium]|nr:ATP-binding protein [Bryobacteraceae bacterium]